MIMLNIYPMAVTDYYLAHMTYFAGLYGPYCWHILARADQWAREQQLERSRGVIARRRKAEGLPALPTKEQWEPAPRHLV